MPGVCASLAFCAFAYPMYVIRPFRAQGTRELAVALVLRTWGPPIAIAAAIVAVTIWMILWQSSRRGTKAWSTSLVLVTLLFAGLAHINVYEMMFHRVDSPQVLPAREAKIDDDDMVLAIRSGGHSRAYAIRMMAYHHIVNDRVGDLPVVSTY